MTMESKTQTRFDIYSLPDDVLMNYMNRFEKSQPELPDDIHHLVMWIRARQMLDDYHERLESKLETLYHVPTSKSFTWDKKWETMLGVLQQINESEAAVHHVNDAWKHGNERWNGYLSDATVDSITEYNEQFRQHPDQYIFDYATERESNWYSRMSDHLRIRVETALRWGTDTAIHL